MKKFISVSLIVAVILLFIGAMFGGIGYAVGGVSYRLQMAEGFKQSLFNEEALRSEYNISASNISNYANVFFDDWEDDSYTIYAGEVGLVGREEIVVSEDIKAIYCKVDATNMEIRVSEDDTYYITSTVNGMFRCFEKDGNLYFEGVKLSPNTLTSYGDLILYVPKDLSLDLFSVSARACNLEVNDITSEEIQCEVGAGLVNFTGVDAGQIVIQLGAGEIDMQDVTSDALLVEVGAGDFELQTGNITKVDLDVGMGNAEIYDIKTDDISAACAMGNIEILIEGSEDDYDYVANCVAGNVSIGNSGGIIIGTQRWDSPGDKKINADCAMGNIEIDFEE